MTSGWEATPEGGHQAGRPLQADLPADQGPGEVPLLRQETEPGPAVGDDTEVGGADVPRLDPDRLAPDDDRRLGGLLPVEFEVIGGVQALRGVPLEGVREDGQEGPDRPGPPAAADPPGPLVGVPLRNIRLGVRAGDDVHRLLFLLQRVDDLLQEALAVGQEWADYVVARGAGRHTVGRLVIRPDPEALPDRDGLRVLHPAAVVACVLAVGDLLD